MRSREHVTLLLEGTKPTTEWDLVGNPGDIVRVPSFQIIDGALEMGLNDLGIDVDSIVFDRSVDEDQLLTFLCHSLPSFRGDVLAIQDDGSAFLSTVSPRGDGRYLYQLSPDDVDFYLFARFGTSCPFSGAFSKGGFHGNH